MEDYINLGNAFIAQGKLDEAIRHYSEALRLRPDYADAQNNLKRALAAGETPEWVARTLGHVDTSMVYRTYGRYIPNLTRQDGSAFERQYREATNEKRQPK